MNVDQRIKELERTVDSLRSKLYSGKEEVSYKNWKDKACASLVEYIESMAAAYCKHTDINPNDCVLCTSITDEGKQLLYWFEKRKEGLEAIERRDYING